MDKLSPCYYPRRDGSSRVRGCVAKETKKAFQRLCVHRCLCCVCNTYMHVCVCVCVCVCRVYCCCFLMRGAALPPPPRSSLGLPTQNLWKQFLHSKENILYESLKWVAGRHVTCCLGRNYPSLESWMEGNLIHHSSIHVIPSSSPPPWWCYKEEERSISLYSILTMVAI